MESTACPHCGVRSELAGRDTCPACGKDFRQALQPTPSAIESESAGSTGEPDSTVHGSGHAATAETSPVKPSTYQLVKNFQQDLARFTPRLVGTPLLVIANVLVFLVMVARGVNAFSPTVQSLVDWGADYGPKTMSGQWWRLVTCMFLHCGILHLVFNMWVLWDLGRLVERLVGNVGFLVLYFVSGIAGSLASLAWNPTIVSAGASGAVFGVAGALVGLLSFRRDAVPAPVLKHLRSSMGVFLLYNVVYGLRASGIDMAAHIGGLLAGFLCGLVLSQPLSAEALSRRRRRNIALIAMGAIALPLAALSLPSAPPDVGGEIERLVDIEKRALAAYNDLVRRSKQGKLSDAEFAKAIDRDVLPPWIDERRTIDAMIDAPHADRASLVRVAQYMTAREEAWQLLSNGLRGNDAEKVRRANQRMADAEKLANEISD